MEAKKREMQESVKSTSIKPFLLRTEWTWMSTFNKYRKEYEKLKISGKVPESKLIRLELDTKASQWQLIEKLASKNSRKHSLHNQREDLARRS